MVRRARRNVLLVKHFFVYPSLLQLAGIRIKYVIVTGQAYTRYVKVTSTSSATTSSAKASGWPRQNHWMQI